MYRPVVVPKVVLVLDIRNQQFSGVRRDIAKQIDFYDKL